ncbi:unnamed protein product [Soboliphyme baturini]|uniref:Secreted protein n=1 Tax=Soboliphyme baturini TaxID=241478 RepID=A0A183IUL8_9BILA|nr:unnamed protein product [Soboliphyme baturini]
MMIMNWLLSSCSMVDTNLYTFAFQIRVVNAFRMGIERREPSLSGPSVQRLREISRQLQLQQKQRSRTTSIAFPFSALNIRSLSTPSGQPKGYTCIVLRGTISFLVFYFSSFICGERGLQLRVLVTLSSLDSSATLSERRGFTTSVLMCTFCRF